MGRERRLPTAHEMKFENSRIGMHLFRTGRAPTVLVSLQPINIKYSRGAKGVFTVYKTKLHRTTWRSYFTRRFIAHARQRHEADWLPPFAKCAVDDAWRLWLVWVWVWVEFNAPPDTVSVISQPINWLILTNKTIQKNTDKQTQYKSEK